MNINFSKYQWLTIGANIVVTMLFSIGLGYWLDQRFNSSPWMMLLMITLAIAQVFVLFWRITKNISKQK